jgi:hypothetical protein
MHITDVGSEIGCLVRLFCPKRPIIHIFMI